MSAPVHEAILDDMDDGVVSIAKDGSIIFVNAAAARILGLEGARVEGRKFGEVFAALEGLDPFTETVLDAVGEEQDIGRKAIEIHAGGERRLLKIGTSWLHSGKGADSRRAGIVAVFSDITEIQELRETEIRLGERIREQYGELQDAYRKIEESNSELSSTLRRVQAIKVVAAAVAAIILGAGYYAWRTTQGPIAAEAAAPAGEGGQPRHPGRPAPAIALDRVLPRSAWTAAANECRQPGPRRCERAAFPVRRQGRERAGSA